MFALSFDQPGRVHSDYSNGRCRYNKIYIYFPISRNRLCPNDNFVRYPSRLSLPVGRCITSKVILDTFYYTYLNAAVLSLRSLPSSPRQFAPSHHLFSLKFIVCILDSVSFSWYSNLSSPPNVFCTRPCRSIPGYVLIWRQVELSTYVLPAAMVYSPFPLVIIAIDLSRLNKPG